MAIDDDVVNETIPDEVKRYEIQDPTQPNKDKNLDEEDSSNEAISNVSKIVH